MRYVFVFAMLGMLLLGSFIQSASAQLQVSVGYLDNQHGELDPSQIPIFRGHPPSGPFSPLTTIVIGNVLDSTASSLDPVDSGVIRFQTIGTDVLIETVRVVTEGVGDQEPCSGGVFKIWDEHFPTSPIAPQGAIRVVPGGGGSTNSFAPTIVLLQTANFNFDSSDCGLRLDPVVIITTLQSMTGEKGPQYTCVDTARVLLGREDAGARGQNESAPFQQISCVLSLGGPP